MSRRINRHWKKILDTVVIVDDALPSEYIKELQIILVDGSSIKVNSEEELIEKLNMLRKNSKTDPIEDIFVSMNPHKLKFDVEKRTDGIIKKLFKKRESSW